MRYRDVALFTRCAIGILRHLLCVLSVFERSVPTLEELDNTGTHEVVKMAVRRLSSGTEK